MDAVPADGGDPPGQVGSDTVQRMARGGGLNLVGAVCAQLSVLAVTVLLARVLGREAVGLYAQCFAFLSLLSLLALSGFRAGLTRFIAVHLAEDDSGGIRGTLRMGLAFTTIGSVVLAAALFASAPWLALRFDDAALTGGLRWIAVTLPAVTITDAALAATQGWRSMRAYAVIGNIVEPLGRVALTGALLLAGLGWNGALVALAVSNWIAALLACGALLRQLRGIAPEPPRYYPRQLFSFSSVSWLASLASTGLIWASTLQLGLLRDSAEVGTYNVATRLITLAVFVMPPINAAFSPHIAHLHHQRRFSDLERAYGVATSWIVRLSLPAFVALLAFPTHLLGAFGDEFRAGAAVTVILALGKFVDAATGPCGLMLNMSGRPVISMVNNVAVLILNVCLNAWLIPTHGIVGAAVAWAISLWVVNAAKVTQTWWLLGMLPFDAGVLKGLAAGVGALGVSLLAVRLGNGPAEVVIGLPAAILTYLGLIVLLGITEDDRIVLRMLTRRLRRG